MNSNDEAPGSNARNLEKPEKQLKPEFNYAKKL